MSLTILQSDFLASIQDLGRFGYQGIGVSVGGPMDEHAFLWNNHLLHNPPNAAQIEIMVGLFKCQFLKPTMIALCGANMNAKLNGNPIGSWQSHYVNAGDTLELGAAQQGLYSYLAIKDGFDTPLSLGSRTTVIRDELGGIDAKGQKLIKGDNIRYHQSSKLDELKLAQRFIPSYDKEIKLGVIPTAQFNDFSDDMQQKFFTSIYTLTQEINRMGLRLSGEAISCEKRELYSEAVGLGAVQIPADGQPIILMRDRQTIGGYPKMGYICKRDISHIAQAAPGTKVQFYKKELTQAEREFKEYQKFFMVC
ncbi:MAG: biotin-dependent carboxyltransferase family protein [Alphaproteobacteria bacterium]